jgi:hypothetical protein
MKSREKLLAIVVAALVVLVGLRTGVTFVSDSFAARETRLETANQNLRDKQLEVAKGNKAASQLKAWAEQSLPSDRPAATSLYQKWLLEIATKTAGIRNAHVAAEGARESVEARRYGAAQAAAPTYQQLSFTLNGSGSLTQIVRLLYAFHSANHLHRIATLKIEPAEQGSDLAINMRIEAIILSRTTRTDSLNKDKSDRLAFGDLAAYEKAIVGRNLFAEYKPPPPPVQERPRVVETPRPPPKPAFDHAKHAEITGIVGQGDQSQLWLRVKTTDEEFKLAEGEEFSVGDMKCKVIRIGLREAELATGDRHFIMRLRDNLRDAATAKSSDL